MGSKTSNSAKSKFFDDFKSKSDECNIEEYDVAKRCSFNFSFFDESQKCGKTWKNVGDANVVNINEKIKNFSRESLVHWKSESVKSGRSIYEEYDEYPTNNDFEYPKNVPKGVIWGRFRISAKMRLVGFTIPKNLHGNIVSVSNRDYVYSTNTFYIVFLDTKHVFYKTEKK